MDNQVFDKFAKQRLESAESTVNSQVWRDIRKRMGTPWMLFLNRYALPIGGTLVGLSLLASAWFVRTNQKTIDTLVSENLKLKKHLEQRILHKPQTIYHNRVDTIYIVKRIFLEEYARPNRSSHPPISFPLSEKNIATEPRSASSPILATATDSIPLQNHSENTRDLTLNDKKQHENTNSDSSKNHTETKTTAQIGKKPNKFRLPTPQIRAGLDSKFTNNMFGFGMSVELFLSNRWSVFTGLNAHKHEKIEYKNLKEYNISTGQDFVAQFGKSIPKNDFISDITIRNTVLESPIGMRYYFPIKRDFSLVFGAYTNLDLKVYERIKIESYLNAEERYTSFEEILSPQTFYDAVFSIGLQRKWNNLFFELAPYTTIRLREPNYNADTNEKIGLKASIYIK